MAKKISTNVNKLQVISSSKQTPQTVAENTITSGTMLFPVVESDIDDQIFDVDLTQSEDFKISSDAVKIGSIPKVISDSKQIPQLAKTSVSQPAFRTSGAFNIASASASVRAVNSPTIVNQSFKVSATSPTQTTDFKDAKVFDDLRTIKPSRQLKVNTPVEELTIDSILGDKYNSLSEKVSTLGLTDRDGTIEGIDISNANYLQTDLDKIISSVSSTSDDKTESGILEFEAGSLIAPKIIPNNTLERSQNGDTTLYFAFGKTFDSDDFEDSSNFGDKNFYDIGMIDSSSANM